MGRVVVRVRLNAGRANGKLVGGHTLDGERDHYLVMYQDEAERLKPLATTEDDVRVREAAKRIHEDKKAEWMDEHGADAIDPSMTSMEQTIERERLERQCPLHPVHYLQDAAATLGLDKSRYKAGFPPFAEVEIVREMDPPDTPDTVAARAADRQGELLERLIEALGDKLTGQGHGKRRGGGCCCAGAELQAMLRTKGGGS